MASTFSRQDKWFISILSVMAVTIIAGSISSELGYLDPILSKIGTFLGTFF